MAQNSPEWDEIRLGKFTASMVDNLWATKTTAAYRNTVRMVAYQRLTGEKPDGFYGNWMQRGHEMEAEGTHQYELETFQKVEEVGFCEHDNGREGCSPDGFVGTDGMMQLKSPKYSTIFDHYALKDEPSDKKALGRGYFHQVQMEMRITGRKWSDFVVFHPSLPLYIRRVKADIVVHTELDQKILEAEAEVETLIESVKKYKNG